MNDKKKGLFFIFAVAGGFYLLKDENVFFRSRTPLALHEKKGLPVSTPKIVSSSSDEQIQIQDTLSTQNSSRAKDPKRMTLEEAYCQIMKMSPQVPISGQSKFDGYFGHDTVARSEDHMAIGDPIINLLIMDKDCPRDKYSVIKARQKDGHWITEKTLNCKTVTHEELFSAYAVQYTIEFRDRRASNTFNFALNGPGLFVTACKDGLTLTRKGKFQLNGDGNLENSNGCLLLGNFLNPLQVMPGEELGEGEYCFSEEQCIAVLNRDHLTKFKGKLTAPFDFSIGFQDRELLRKTLKLPDYFRTEVIPHVVETLNHKDLFPSGMIREGFRRIKDGFQCPH